MSKERYKIFHLLRNKKIYTEVCKYKSRSYIAYSFGTDLLCGIFGRERFDEIGKKIKAENDVLLQIGGGGKRYVQLGPPGTLNSTIPCAACKLLTRRCTQECPFSPSLPMNPRNSPLFTRFFGASNVSKMLMVRCPETPMSSIS